MNIEIKFKPSSQMEKVTSITFGGNKKVTWAKEDCSEDCTFGIQCQINGIDAFYKMNSLVGLPVTGITTFDNIMEDGYDTCNIQHIALYDINEEDYVVPEHLYAKFSKKEIPLPGRNLKLTGLEFEELAAYFSAISAPKKELKLINISRKSILI